MPTPKYYNKKVIEAEKLTLAKRLNAIAKMESEALIATHFKRLEKMYVGKTFKVRNSFGANNTWWQYVKVTSIVPQDIYTIGPNNDEVTGHFCGYAFEKCSDGSINIETNYRGYLHSIKGRGVKPEVFKTEFDYLKMLIRPL